MKEMEKEDNLLVLGQVRVTSEIIPEPKEFLFGLILSRKDVFRTWVSEYRDVSPFRYFKGEVSWRAWEGAKRR